MNNIVNTHKQKPILDEDVPEVMDDLSDAAAEIETAELQEDDEINFDDGLDDGNENPVAHTLIDAAENRGEQARDDSRELDGEAQEAVER